MGEWPETKAAFARLTYNIRFVAVIWLLGRVCNLLAAMHQFDHWKSAYGILSDLPLASQAMRATPSEAYGPGEKT